MSDCTRFGTVTTGSTKGPPVRIGLSATQKPIDEVARYLTGTSSSAADCTIVDKGHRRDMDLTVEMPRSPLEAVMSHEVWEEYYNRLTELIEQHQTTLIFVNTRRMAERLARHLSERLGETQVTAHHVATLCGMDSYRGRATAAATADVRF